MIFFAGRHGHLRAHDHRVDESTLALCMEYVNRGWDTIHLGPLSIMNAARAIAVSSTEDLDALAHLITCMRHAQPGLQCAASLPDEPLPTDVWQRLITLFDWLSVSTQTFATLRPLLFNSPHVRLCLDFPVDVDASPDALLIMREKVIEVVELVDMIHFFHDSANVSHRVGGSERASAKLTRIASSLTRGLPLEVMISGRIKHGEDARRVVQALPGALIGMHRAAWALPDVLERDARGQLGVYCTGCMACEEEHSFDTMSCALRFSRQFLEALKKDPPVVLQLIGASYGALTLGIEALRAGTSRVELFTLGEQPGGMMRLRGRVPQQAEQAEAALTRFEQCKTHPRFTLHDEPYSGEALVARLLATPAVRVMSMSRQSAPVKALSALDSALHHDAIELLKRGSAPADRTSHALWIVRGDTLLAAECALFLRMQWREVWWVGESLAGDTLPLWQDIYTERLEARGVTLMRPGELATRAEGREEVHVVVAGGPGARRELVRKLCEACPGMHELEDAYEPVLRRHHMQRFGW